MLALAGPPVCLGVFVVSLLALALVRRRSAPCDLEGTAMLRFGCLIARFVAALWLGATIVGLAGCGGDCEETAQTGLLVGSAKRDITPTEAARTRATSSHVIVALSSAARARGLRPVSAGRVSCSHPGGPSATGPVVLLVRHPAHGA